MCKVFNSEFTDEEVLQAKLILQALIAGRPTESSEIKLIMQDILDNEDEITEMSNNADITEFQSDEWFESVPLTRKAASIKAASPFTQVFLDIDLVQKEVKVIL